MVRSNVFNVVIAVSTITMVIYLCQLDVTLKSTINKEKSLQIQLYNKLSELPISDIEEWIFGQNKTEELSDSQLFGANQVRVIRNLTIGKEDFCGKHPNLTSIVFVWSRVNATDQRNAIRQTWAQKTYGNNSRVKVLFILASHEDQDIQEKVIEEDEVFGDILQFQLLDSYHNCTLKSIGVLRWTEHFCKSAKFIMKTDDDMIVNIDNLDSFVARNRQAKKTIYGIVYEENRPDRRTSSKWYTSYNAMPDKYFPDYIVGAHMMTTDCVRVLYVKSLMTLPALWIEDVYITGTLPEDTDLKRQYSKQFMFIEWMDDWEDKWEELYDKLICIGHKFTIKKMHQLYKRVSGIVLS